MDIADDLKQSSVAFNLFTAEPSSQERFFGIDPIALAIGVRKHHMHAPHQVGDSSFILRDQQVHMVRQHAVTDQTRATLGASLSQLLQIELFIFVVFKQLNRTFSLYHDMIGLKALAASRFSGHDAASSCLCQSFIIAQPYDKAKNTACQV